MITRADKITIDDVCESVWTLDLDERLIRDIKISEPEDSFSVATL